MCRPEIYGIRLLRPVRIHAAALKCPALQKIYVSSAQARQASTLHVSASPVTSIFFLAEQSMKLEINTSVAAARTGQMQPFLRQFIDDKILLVQQHQDEALFFDVRAELVWKKYQASLWMVGRRLTILDERDIVLRAGVTPEVLRGWQQERNFNALVAEHYIEFLEWIIVMVA